MNNKICYKGDGTKKTGAKIIAKLEKLGGRNSAALCGHGISHSYYFINDGEIDLDKKIPNGYKLISLDDDIKVGDAVKIKPDSRYRTSCEINWRDEGWGGLISVHRKIQYIFKIVEDLIYVDDETYGGNDYLVIERENIELIESKMKNRTLTPENAKRIINIACSAWKSKLAELWAKNIVLGNNTEVPEGFYVEMRKACIQEQHKLFDEIFGKDDGLIKAIDLKEGECILSKDDHQDALILRTALGFVDLNDLGWGVKDINPLCKGKKVKFRIIYEEI